MTTARHLTGKGVRPEWPCFCGEPVISVNRRSRCLQRIVAVWQAAINFLVPIGYEDESGFHYGEPPAAKRRRSTPAY